MTVALVFGSRHCGQSINHRIGSQLIARPARDLFHPAQCRNSQPDNRQAARAVCGGRLDAPVPPSAAHGPNSWTASGSCTPC
ncbi:hypothetical protein [Kitasatospora sp. MMS16-BH015]|uniref:hypothetical protein n=1 Tax=Kitasatospora sp. MMS16-BH015 TaxID=2018025 RepID=UPI00131A5297|nr:hypothetical protein [Kitasatospora sp. MMS16-BH015]